MDTIQEVSINPTDSELLVSPPPPPCELELEQQSSNTDDATAANSTTKSSQDSSFTVTDYNCSSLREDQPVVVSDKVVDIIELIDDHHPCLVDVDAVKVLNGGDGSDSGIEFGGVTGSLNDADILQRALSNNSAGYASSCCGLEEINGVSVSCNSSMISYCSDAYDKTGSTILIGGRLNNDYCASEGGSESSSVTGGPVSSIRKAGSIAKKKVVVKEPLANRLPRKFSESSSSARSSSRSRASSLGRSVSLNLKTPPTSAMNVAAAARESARSREKVNTICTSNSKTMPSPKQSTLTKRPTKPDSLPSGIKDASPNTQRVSLSRTPSITRGRTPLGTPTDDGRWPSIGGKGNVTPRSAGTRASSAAPEGVSIKTRVGTLALEAKPCCTPDKFGTLPRRRKEKSAEDLKGASPRSESLSREQNRMTSSLVKKLPSSKQDTPTKTLSNHPKLASVTKKLVQKTKIYHETSVQTAITCKDVEDAFCGKVKDIRVDAIEVSHKHTQSDIRDKEMEKLEEKLKKLTAEYSTLMTKHSEKSQMVTALEQKLLKEREEKLAAQKELQNNSERVLGLLETVQGTPVETGGECDSLLMLESQLHMSGCVLEKKQEEISKLRNICHSLQTDMEKSLKNQEELLRQKTELEEESCEMQDFLQAEKASCVEALKEAELEISQLRQSLAQREGEIERQQEECRHLVRIGEQRRQEYLGMQAKYNALESRSKDILLQQGAAVSGASVALSGLGSRLDHLVEQLIASYNISEQDLEDVIYHNEAYTHSSSGDGSPEFEQHGVKYPDSQLHRQQHLAPDSSQKCSKSNAPLSPQRGHSFIAAVISAIKNATGKTDALKANASTAAAAAAAAAVAKEKKEICGHESDSTEMLDSETEPCLMMDNVLEDVTMPDSHSHNMVSSSTRISQIEMPSSMESGANMMISHDESLDNLSQAIANRQQIELQSSIMASGRSPRFRQPCSGGGGGSSEQRASVGADNTTASHSSSLEDEENSCCGETSIAEMPSICEYCNAQSLVDQVIDVDNLITKLLKVLRIVQMDNDHCIQELINHKNRLALTNEEIQDRVKEYEELNQKLRDDLKDSSHQLLMRGNELAKSRSELQSHRKEIDKLNEDICQLSTLCSNNNNNQKSNSTGLVINREDIISALKLWNENDSIPERELIQHVVQACNEIPRLKARLYEKEQLLQSLTTTGTGSGASWHQALNEAKRQYEAIDRALETLHSVQSLVQQTPALKQLQRDLEETNFQAIPLVSLPTHVGRQNGTGIDMNANQTSPNGLGVVVVANGSGSAVAGLQLNQPDFIDSTA
ncbi:uncharacterized protein LOC129769112 [Toxorhynchites rutilus septentrionalis]|uniref:uncharacterized protein LOC129769112 n=1 Tax=Toxorhynchites rutilus septentrionalis TaxID=329112 RepID=UPI00247B2CFF|nr:uncharacterized protein LOC129769112 [Toxorhynchites rutilus septentrionalis]